MSQVSQPGGNCDKAARVTIGIRTNYDRCCITMMLYHDSSTITAGNLCEDAVNSVISTIVPLLQPVISENAHISFVQAEGVLPLTIPYRVDIATGQADGTNGPEPFPTSVGLLMDFYSDPDSLPPASERIRVAKNCIPGIPDSVVTGDVLDDTDTYNALEALASALATGFESDIDASAKWYRAVGVYQKPPDANTPVIRVGSYETRRYTSTQRRRILPH